MDGWMDGWMHVCVYHVCMSLCMCVYVHIHISYMHAYAWCIKNKGSMFFVVVGDGTISLGACEPRS